MTTQREQFEAWLLSTNPQCATWDQVTAEFRSEELEYWWSMWQAAQSTVPMYEDWRWKLAQLVDAHITAQYENDGEQDTNQKYEEMKQHILKTPFVVPELVKQPEIGDVLAILINKTPREEGYTAYANGLTDASNPYKIGTDDAMDWNDGFAEAEAESNNN